jgi:hypothetical protein
MSENLTLIGNGFLYIAVILNLLSAFVNWSQIRRSKNEIEKYRKAMQKIAFGSLHRDEIINLAVETCFTQGKRK